MLTLAPMILEKAPIKWDTIANVHPPCLRTEKVPMKYRSLFSRAPPRSSATTREITNDTGQLVVNRSSQATSHLMVTRSRSRTMNATIS